MNEFGSFSVAMVGSHCGTGRRSSMRDSACRQQYCKRDPATNAQQMLSSGNSASPMKPTRGYIDGCFDIMHSGHFNAIRQAKAICDVLVVGVHSDEEIARNKAIPVMRQAERYALLEHIKWIDEIIYDVPYSPLISTLDRAHADFCIHGDDMPVNGDGVCAYGGMRDAGKLRIIRRTEGVSTTDLIGRLLTLARREDRSDTLATSNVKRSEVQDRIDKMIKKYNMSFCDIASLQKLALGASLQSADQSTEEQPESGVPNLRTQAPVHLLTSTRRITEFATGKAPKDTDRVVYVSGAFDMFHVGHAQFLKDARALGTFLVVGVQDDDLVAQRKGRGYPIMSLNERVLNICACKWVDEVLIGAPKNFTEDLVKSWRVAAVAKGSRHRRQNEWKKGCEETVVAEQLGIFHLIQSKWPQLCNETVLERIVAERETYVHRNKDRAQREDKYYRNKSANSPQEA